MSDSLFRVRDWRTRLTSWAYAQVGRPLVWGETDCAALARTAWAHLFGQDVVPTLPRWSNVREAVEVWRAHGPMGRILEAAGATQTTIPFLRSGDLVIMGEPEEEVGHEAMLICIDGRDCLTSSPGGVILTQAEEGGIVYSLWEVPAHG